MIALVGFLSVVWKRVSSGKSAIDAFGVVGILLV